MSINPNLVVWVSDTHVSQTDPPTATGRVGIAEILSLARHINSLEAYLTFDLGDWGDHHGSLQDYQDYKDYFHDIVKRFYTFTRGNHDEDEDVGVGTSTAFTIVDSVFPTKAYRGYFDWPAPKIRFIVFHATIVHTGASEGLFSVTAEELDLLDAMLAATPADYKIIVCSHPPRLNAFGNNIADSLGGTDLDAILALYEPRILAYLNGHRHSICNTGVDGNGILHINGGSVSKIAGEDDGGYMAFIYNPGASQVRMEFLEATSNATPRCAFGVSGAVSYTPIVFNL